MSGAKARDASGFSARTMILLVLVGVVCLAGLSVLSAYAPELKSGNDGGGHALSKSSVGFAATSKLLTLTGQPVLTRRGPLGPAAEDSLLILTPTAQTRPEQIAAIEHTGPLLIVLPKWQTAPDERHPGWVKTVLPYAPATSLGVLPKTLKGDLVLNSRRGEAGLRLRRPKGGAVGGPLKIDRLQTLQGKDMVPVLLDDAGGVVLAMKPEGWTYVLADPDLLNTQALKTANGARVAVEILDLIRADDTPVVFDLTLHGFSRPRSLLRLMLQPPLLGVTLVMLAIAALAGFQAAVRFGPARRPARAVALGKAALADNTAALVRLARREHRMALPYAHLVRASVARAIAAPRGLDGEELDAFLDRVGVLSGATNLYSALAERAKAASAPADLMAVARDLHIWKQELVRGRQ